MFNSREYEWADITFILGGRDVTGIRGVKYDRKIEREAVFAKGREAHKIQSGNISVTGEINLLQNEYEALVAAGRGTILGMSLDALVSYGNPAEGSVMLTDRIEGIQFTTEEKAWKQGDKFTEITIPFIALKIVNQV